MADKLLAFLASVLGEQNATYLWVRSALGFSWDWSVRMVGGAIFIALWLTFMYHLVWKKWLKYAAKNKNAGFSGYMEENWAEMIIRFFVWTGVLMLLYGSGGIIDVVAAGFRFFWGDNENYSGIQFMCAYDRSSKCYQWTLGWSAVLAVWAGCVATFHAVVYYVVNGGAEGFGGDGGTTDHMGGMKKFWVLFALVVGVFHSTIPEVALNWLFFKPFRNTTLHEYVTGSENLSDG